MAHLRFFRSANMASMSEVVTILKLLMVMPATSTVNEGTALSQGQVKAINLFSKVSEYLMTLHIHKDYTDNLPLKCCLNEIVDNTSHRL